MSSHNHINLPSAYHQSNNDPTDKNFDIYSETHLHPSTKNPYHSALQHALQTSDANNLPQISVSPHLGKFLSIQAKLVNAKNILEVGTLGGYSTIWMASSNPDVKIVTVDVDPHHKKVAEENFKFAGVDDRVQVRLGPGLEILPQLLEEFKAGKRPAFDMVFIDADKLNNLAYVNFALEMTRSKAVIVVDNVVRKGRVADASLADKDESVKGSRILIEGVGKDDRLEATALQTISGHRHDGFLIALVK